MPTGYLPSKTSIQASDGGTIPAASASGAGVMTADQVKQLETLWRLHQQGGSGGTVILAPEPVRQPAIDVTPLRDALMQLGHRVARIESEPRQLVSQAPVETMIPGPDYLPRIEALELQVRELVATFDAFAGLVDERLGFIERTALGQITVKAE